MKSLYVLGRGQLGRRLSHAARGNGWSVRSRSARRALPARFEADLLVLAVRDGQIEDCAGRLARKQLRVGAVLHCAGSVGPQVLNSLTTHRCGLGQLHPLLALGPGVKLAGAQALVNGDRTAVRWANELARSLGMRVVQPKKLDVAAYHAAAALLANGSVALASAAAELMRSAGIREPEAGLASLLQSVAENLASQGLPDALTGPIRRGDHHTVSKHLDVIRRRAPELHALYVASAEQQLLLARQLRKAAAEDFDRIEKLVKK